MNVKNFLSRHNDQGLEVPWSISNSIIGTVISDKSFVDNLSTSIKNEKHLRLVCFVPVP